MPTFRGRVENREIRLFAAISIGSPPSARTEPKSYPAILDTGAQGTMISQKVVDEGKLSSIGFTDIIPVSGDPIQTEKYRVRVDIPIGDQLETPGGEPAHGSIYEARKLKFPCFRSSLKILTYCLAWIFFRKFTSPCTRTNSFSVFDAFFDERLPYGFV